MARMFYRLTHVLLAVAVCGCSTEARLPAASGAALEPIAFFTGRTQGYGKLDKLFSDPVEVTVDSIGRRQGHTLMLDQTIREGDKAPRLRRWTIRSVGPNRYLGTLTDAQGPVHITISGPRAYVRYKMEGGMNVEQQLALQSDGRTVLNRLNVQKFGVRFASLNETIRKLD
ncbi:MAG: DUF3833 family protein [Sphingomicrobium sp.]